jgi:hypothetical protein
MVSFKTKKNDKGTLIIAEAIPIEDKHAKRQLKLAYAR